MFGKQDKMDVRCSSETEANRVSKNGHKEGKESKGSEGNISTSFLKDQQGTFSASAATEGCNKSKSSSADPDYCRRILVRGMSLRCLARVGEGELRSRPGDGFILSLCLGSGPGLKALPRLRGRDPAARPGFALHPAPSGFIPGNFRRRLGEKLSRGGSSPERTSPAHCCFVFFFSFPALPLSRGARPRGEPSGTALPGCAPGPGALLPRPRIAPAAGRAPWRGAAGREPLRAFSFPLRARQTRGKGWFKITISLKINGGMTKGFLIITF